MSAGVSNLTVPPPSPAVRPSNPRTSSSGSISRVMSRVTDALHPSSSRDSVSSMTPEVGTPAVEMQDVSRRPATARADSASDVRSDATTEVAACKLVSGQDDTPATAVTNLLAGRTHKLTRIHTKLLMDRSPYFRDLFTSSPPPSTPLVFEDLDEVVFALFHRWIYGTTLNGPSDFHSMHHYLGLYVLAERFRIERLKNEVVDLVRAYYRTANMTAPAYRLEYIYANTMGANPMRRFLITTAAYRVLCAHGDPHISESIRGVIAKGGDLAVDYAEALVHLNANGLVDVRRSSDCAFHEHHETRKCKERGLEPYQNA